MFHWQAQVTWPYLTSGGRGKYNPTVYLEGESSGTIVTSLQGFLNMIKAVRDLEFNI